MTEQEQPLSKTEVKKQMLKLQELGEKVVALPDNLFLKIPLDDQLRGEMLTARKITKHGGLKRQLQYIGKLMRHRDVSDIQSAIDDIELGSQKDNDTFHLKEGWRDNLLLDDKKYLTAFYKEYPETDLQLLRQHLRNFKTAKTEAKKKQFARVVFKIVAEQIDNTER